MSLLISIEYNTIITFNAEIYELIIAKRIIKPSLVDSRAHFITNLNIGIQWLHREIDISVTRVRSTLD